jgi:hypothetical protein
MIRLFAANILVKYSTSHANRASETQNSTITVQVQFCPTMQSTRTKTLKAAQRATQERSDHDRMPENPPRIYSATPHKAQMNLRLGNACEM